MIDPIINDGFKFTVQIQKQDSFSIIELREDTV